MDNNTSKRNFIDDVLKELNERQAQNEINCINDEVILEKRISVDENETKQVISVKTYVCGCPSQVEPGICCDICKRIPCCNCTFTCSVAGCGIICCRHDATIIDDQVYCPEHSFFKVAIYRIRKIFGGKNGHQKYIRNNPTSNRRWIAERSNSPEETNKNGKDSKQNTRR